MVNDYIFNDQESLIYVQLFRAPGAQGHDHVMRAVGYPGVIAWDTSNPGACEVSVTLDVGALAVDEPEMRAFVGYDQTLSENQRNSIRSTMLGDDQLWYDQFKMISYEATGCENIDGGLRVFGDLTIRGVTQNVPIDMAVQFEGENVYAQGQMTITHTQFGFEPYEFLAFKNDNEIFMTLDVVGFKAD